MIYLYFSIISARPHCTVVAIDIINNLVNKDGNMYNSLNFLHTLMHVGKTRDNVLWRVH